MKKNNMEYKGLPLYQARITDEETGVYNISLVDMPATESDFIYFAEQKQPLKFAIENEDKHIVRGLVMGADMPIYRVNPYGYEFYITYDADTIRKMCKKYLKNGYQNNVDTMHNDVYVDGVYMVQSFIKDAENGIDPKGFESYKDGSWFAEFYVENPEIWSQIKDGTFKGFSLAGIFSIGEVEYRKQDEDKDYEECIELINKIKNILK